MWAKVGVLLAIVTSFWLLLGWSVAELLRQGEWGWRDQNQPMLTEASSNAKPRGGCVPQPKMPSQAQGEAPSYAIA